MKVEGSVTHAEIRLSHKSASGSIAISSSSLTNNSVVSDGGSYVEPNSYLVVRYFLDRPGYDFTNSSSRLWRDPPSIVRPDDIRSFLVQQEILPSKEQNNTSTKTPFLVEVYLDHFESFMLLDVCEREGMEFDFSKVKSSSDGSSSVPPGIINLRLTDVPEAQLPENVTKNESSNAGGEGDGNDGDDTDPSFLSSPAFLSLVQATAHHICSHPPPQQFCNTSPTGLFAFSMTVWMEAIDLFGELFHEPTHLAFRLVWPSYAFYVAGLLQFVVGLIEAKRNNVYGATAFLTFGSFWMANGTTKILATFSPDQINPDFIEANNATSRLLHEFWKILFVCALLKQTLVLNKLSTYLISVLLVMLVVTALSGYTTVFLWMQFIMTIVVSSSGFYVFIAEFTNEVYHREVFDLYPWKTITTTTKDPVTGKNITTTVPVSSGEVFGAAGRISKLQTRAIDLRLAGLRKHINNNNKDEKQSPWTGSIMSQSRAS